MRNSDLLRPEQGWACPDRIRIPAPPRREQALLLRSLSGVARFFGRAELPHIFPVMGINGRLFWPWLVFASQMMPFGRLPATDREKAILRVAWHCRSRYEWGQHVEMALKVGVSDQEIVEMTKPSMEIANCGDQLLAETCDQLCQQRLVDEENWLALNKRYTQKQVIELTMLVGHYVMVAGLLVNAGIKLEPSSERVLQDFYERLRRVARG